jgi:glycosyltransferase involved in cell wall biosynthesis
VRVKNEARAIPEFLRRLDRQQNRDNVELIFLDSGSTDGTVELLGKVDCNLYQIAPEDFQFGSTCNLLMSLSKSPVCVFLSGHVLLQDENILQTVLRRLSGNEAAALYFRQVTGELFGSTASQRAYLARRFPEGKQSIILQDPGSFSNAASALTRTAWERTPFPEVTASEDFLWAKQHLIAGGKLEYFPHLTVEHSHCESPDDIYRRVRINSISRGLNKSPMKAAKFFVGVFGATLKHGANVPEALRYAASHARAYL